eukprot:scaffold5224_cov181-Pinguiococcus_pyrenoidosus.AAC.1
MVVPRPVTWYAMQRWVIGPATRLARRWKMGPIAGPIATPRTSMSASRYTARRKAKAPASRRSTSASGWISFAPVGSASS